MRKALSTLAILAVLMSTLALVSGPVGAVGFGTVTGTAYDENGDELAGVTVTLYQEDDVGGSPVAQGVTGADGFYTLLNVPAGIWVALFRFPDNTIECFDTTFGGGSFEACLEGNQAVVNVIDGVLTSGINVIKDVIGAGDCSPTGVAATGLTNVGFETGNLNGWTQGTVVDSVAVTGADTFETPYEGSFMARLGSSAAGPLSPQPRGSNMICQDFVADQASENFVFSIFTYDYTGFDLARFTLTVEGPGGDTIGRYEQSAWGVNGDTSLKTSGWVNVNLDLSAYVGQTLRLTLNGGGTADNLYPFWVYIDSAESGPPPDPIDASEIISAGSSLMPDPSTGLVTIAQSIHDPRWPVTIHAAVDCPGAGAPSQVNIIHNGAQFAMTQTVPGSPNWSGIIPAASVVAGPVSVSASCPTGTVVQQLAEIVLYDPSGYVTDIITGEPVVGATVTLYNVPGWTAATSPSDTGPTVCASNESKPEGDPWSQPAPTEEGVLVPAASDSIDPNVNPFITNSAGYYGWDVAAGCWYVVVEAEGYDTLTSPVVGVPSEVTDLDLALFPDPLPSFPDVPDEHPFWLDITWMAYYEITTGFPDGTFRPGGPVTRQSMAAFLNRLDGEFGGATVRTACTGGDAFPDVPSTHPFCAEIQWMIDEGITTGFDDGNYRPGSAVTRQSMAAFLYRMAGNPDGEEPTCEGPAFPDVPVSHPFCGEIKWMVDAGVTTGFPDGDFRPGAVVSRQAMSAFMHRFADLPA